MSNVLADPEKAALAAARTVVRLQFGEQADVSPLFFVGEIPSCLFQWAFNDKEISVWGDRFYFSGKVKVA